VTDVLKRERKIVRHSRGAGIAAQIGRVNRLSMFGIPGARVLHNGLWRDSSFIGKYGALFGHASAFPGRMLGILGAAQ
jgi:hypothetical protein